jgi:hypothetical protein
MGGIPMTRFAIAAALALAAVLPALSAHAQAPRTFVSAAGSDSNPCSFAAPCRHFQAAVMATSAGGEVDALDPAGYGPIVISQGVTIEGQGWSYIAPPASGNGITINAGSGNVSIHGVSLNGAGITGSTNGIVLNSGASVMITNCDIQNFGNDGILLAPTSDTTKFLIADVIVSDNGSSGVEILPPGPTGSAIGALDHVLMHGNVNFGMRTSRNTNTTTVNVTVRNSVVSNNFTGIEDASVGTVRLIQSSITDNVNGVFVNNPTVESAGNNYIRGNTNNIVGTISTVGTQ